MGESFKRLVRFIMFWCVLVVCRILQYQQARPGAMCKIKGGGHRVPPAGLPIEQVPGEYSLSFLRRDVALFVSTRARDSF